MKTLLPRILPLLLAIILGSVLSWIAIYAFWFGIWTFHNVAAARACGAAGVFLLLPARLVFTQLGGDQTAVFSNPVAYSVANGLVLGVAAHEMAYRFRAWRRPAHPVNIAKPARETGGTPP